MIRRNALVTGGTRGIGRATVLRLVGDGHHVLFTFHRDGRAATRLREETDGQAVGVRADAGDPDAIEEMYAEADRHFAHGGDAEKYLDVLVNNAGTARDRRLVDETGAGFERMLAVHATGFFLTLQEAIPRLREGGRVIAVSSMSTAYATPGEAAYAASKAATEQVVRVAAKELGPCGITVNALAPGPTRTDLLVGATSAEIRESTAAFTPLGRLGTPEDVAAVVSFLTGPDAGWVSGQTVGANGGLA